MKTTINPYLSLIVLLLIFTSCSTDSSEEVKSNDPQSEQIEAQEKPDLSPEANEAPPLEEEANDMDLQETEASMVGSYYNGEGGWVRISNYRMNDGLEYMFDFQFVVSNGDENCNGIVYDGNGIDNGNFTASELGGESSNFKFSKDYSSVNFEPSLDMIGMDCARSLNTKFVKQ